MDDAPRHTSAPPVTEESVLPAQTGTAARQPEPGAAPDLPGVGAWKARGIAAVVAVLVFFALIPLNLNWETRFIAAWDIAVVVLIAEGWWTILRSDPARARLRAAAEDPGRAALLAVSLVFSVISLICAIVAIGDAPLDPLDVPSGVRLALGLTAISGAWFLMHTAYALHYARLYYADSDTADGFEFRGGSPDDADFAYVAFGIGMTFQVPDVNVVSRAMRRVVLYHQVISFVYNTTILALVINLVAGRI